MPLPYKKLIGKTGSSFSIVHTLAPRLSTPWHYHPEFELVYMKQGDGTVFIGDYNGTFEAGCMVFVGRNVPQHWISSRKYHQDGSNLQIEGLVLNFAPDCFGEQFFSLPEMQSVGFFLEKTNSACLVQGETRKKLANLLEQLLQETGPDKIRSFIEILRILSESNELKTLFHSKQDASAFHPDERIEKAFQYLSEHYLLPVRLEELASQISMNPSAFSRLFRQKTNQTVQSYLLDLRIRHASRLLTKTKMPVENVCFDSGFRNLSHFNRIFKRIYQLSPTAYRQKYK